MNYKLAFFSEKIINNNKLKYKISHNIYFYDIENQFDDDILIKDIISYFQHRFTYNKVSYKSNYIINYNSKIII